MSELRMLRLPEVQAVTGLSSVSIWRLEKEDKFPRRRKLGIGQLVGWRSDEIEKWVQDRQVVEPGPGR